MSESNKSEYQPAEQLPCPTFEECLQNIYLQIINFFKVIYFIIYYIFINASNIFKPAKKKSIKGQLAVVTGGGNGLGRAISIQLAVKGCNVIILDVDIDAAEKTAEDLGHMNVKSKAYKVDICQQEEVHNVCEKIKSEFGTVDILVNNAGVMPIMSITQGTTKTIERIIGINFTSQFWTIRELIDGMLEQNRGHIVAISSMSAIEALGNAACYSSTKFGVKGLMDALYEELRINGKQKDIITTTIFPRYINTRKEVIDEFKMSIKKEIFSLLTPEEVANATVDAILKNKKYAYIPKWGKFITALHYFPLEIQDKIRELYKPTINISTYKGNAY